MTTGNDAWTNAIMTSLNFRIITATYHTRAVKTLYMSSGGNALGHIIGKSEQPEICCEQAQGSTTYQQRHKLVVLFLKLTIIFKCIH